MILADQIRHFVLETYILPARERGQSTIHLVAGEIHAEMGLKDRMPAVCGALDAGKFADQCHIVVVSRQGPKYSNTAEWVVEV